MIKKAGLDYKLDIYAEYNYANEVVLGKNWHMSDIFQDGFWCYYQELVFKLDNKKPYYEEFMLHNTSDIGLKRRINFFKGEIKYIFYDISG